MSTYGEAAALKSMLTDIVYSIVESHPIIKRTLKAEKCIIVSEPNQQTHTIKVRLTPLDKTVLELPYAPKIPLSELKPNKAASVWYFYTINNGIVMQNSMWTAYGQDDLENLASGELNLIESIRVLARYVQSDVLGGYSLQFLAPKLVDESATPKTYYIPIGTLPATAEKSYGTISISGRIGGYEANTVNTVNMTIGSGGTLSLMGSYTAPVDFNYIANNTTNSIKIFEAYQAKSSNPGEPNKNPINLYLRIYSGMAVDLSLTAFGAELSRTVESQSETPTGIKLTISNGLVKL